MRLEINPRGQAALATGAHNKELNIYVNHAVFDYTQGYADIELAFAPRNSSRVMVEFKIYKEYPKIKVLGVKAEAWSDRVVSNEQFLEDFAEMANRLKMWFKVEHNGEGFEVVNAKDWGETDLFAALDWYSATANTARKYLLELPTDSTYNAW